ncbi:hypothetical protein [Bacillus sp. OK048]|uniref:hypothetical protein n=1 Tax=Bacillus sp. OK048 TaxID=1882761 RepID=UPI00088E34DA|nr:hypothetical protein [Bacillus sp. OK048]SDM71409.1 hypothetical protein SAMN05443253_10582 [Bacillus sp. OK048]
MEKRAEIQEDLYVIASLQRNLNLATATLLLTGQITIVGVFVTPPEFSISLSGPLFGRARLEGKSGNQFSTALIDVLDVLIAVLLILDEIRLVSCVVGPSRFSIDVSGPIFGSPKYIPTLPTLKKSYHFFQKIVSRHFELDPIFSQKMY